MDSEKLQGRQGGALLLGTAAPLLLESGRGDPLGWSLGLGLALAVGAAAYRTENPEQGLAGRLGQVWGRGSGQAVTAGYLIFTLLLLGRTFAQSAECFPDIAAWPWVPAVLGVLAWLALRQGVGNLARCAGVLWVPLGAIFLWLTLRAGQAGTWDRDAMGGLHGWETGGAALAPALLAAAALPGTGENRKTRRRFALGLGLLGMAWALVSRACLGQGLQKKLPEPFYELVRSVELFEGGAHLEALAAAAQEAGFFLTLGLYGALAGEFAGALGLDKKAWAAPVLALGFAAGGAVRAWGTDYKKVEWVLTGLFCALIPLATQAVVMVQKRAKKAEK